MATRAARGLGQYSGVARAVERVGERWALLIIRDLLVGARRYSDLKAGLPRIPTNILTDRLKELQEAGIVRRVPTVRGGYELTPLGRALEPVVDALERWGWSTLGEPAEGEVVTRDALTATLRAAFRPDVAAGMPPTEYVLHVADASVVAVVANRSLEVVAIGPGALPQPRRADPAEVAFEAGAELVLDPAEFRDLIAGLLDPGAVQLVAGESEAVVRFTRLFRIEPAGPAPDASAEAGAPPASSVA
jgi:DNA-binding HxlR family transcriptional regulator